MKKLITLLVALVILLSFSGKAQAVPMYYTFDGIVSYVNDGAGAIASQFGLGFGVGSAVTYTFIVDFDADGTYTLNDGTVGTMTDNANRDYFYIDYVSGDALAEVGGGVYNAGYDIAEGNVGYDGVVGALGNLSGNSSDDRLEITSFSANASNWAVDTVVFGGNQAYASDGARSQLLSDLTLTDVSPVNAVPEPSTLLLLGSGMLGLLAFRRRGHGLPPKASATGASAA